MLIVLLLCVVSHLMAQEHAYRFHNYTTDDGLPSLVVNDITEDSYGFLWIGTDRGLCRFDAYDFKIYPILSQAAGAQDVWVNALLFTDANTLWVGTEVGLFQLNTQKEVVTTVLDSAYIAAIATDNNQTVWIGTEEGLMQYNADSKALQRVPLVALGEQEPDIFNLLVDRENRLWIATLSHGLLCYHEGKVIAYQQHSTGLSSDILRKLIELPDGRIAIGTKDAGLNILQPATGEFTNYNPQEGDRSSLSHSAAFSLLVDREERLWVGTWGHGLNIMQEQYGDFQHFIANPDNPNSIPNNYVVSLYQSSDGTVWIGTYGGGLGRFHAHEQKIIRFMHDNQNQNSLSADFVRSVHEDEDSVLWIGTSQRGLNRFDLKNNQSTVYLKPANDSRDALARGTIWSISAGSDDVLWFGTSRGIGKLNKRTGQIRFITPSEHGLLGKNVLKVLDDGKGSLWVGSWYGGLNKMDTRTGAFEQYTHDEGVASSLPSNNVNDIFIDGRQRVWVATDGALSLLLPNSNSFKNYPVATRMIAEDKNHMLWLATNKGLARLNAETDSLYYFKPVDGLTNISVNSILVADNGYLWLGSNSGIDVYDPDEGLVKHINKADGLAGNSNVSRACAKGHKGNMYFGGVNGLSQINTETLSARRALPQLQFTNLLLFNRTVNLTDTAMLHQSIHTQESVTFQYKDYIFALEFAAIDFLYPDDVRYEYKLEGFDKTWITTDAKHRKAVYTNLPHGEYQLLVRASAPETVASAETAIKLVVMPPWWKKRWVQACFYLLAGLLIIALFQSRLAGIKNQKRLLEEEVRHRTAEIGAQKQEIEQQAMQLQAMNDQKDKLFSIISHDLRNPLAALKGIIPLLDPKILKEEDLENIRNNIGERIENLSLVMLNLLEWSRSQLAGETTTPEPIDLYELGERKKALFSYPAQKKNIQMFNHFPQGIFLFADVNQVRTILRNAMGNALKFCHQGDCITLHASIGQGMVTIEVRDTGMGMDSSKIASLFSLATNVSTLGTSGEKGVGLGTLLMKEFTEKNGGKIWVESELHVGTSVFFTLPLSKGLPQNHDLEEGQLSAPV